MNVATVDPSGTPEAAITAVLGAMLKLRAADDNPERGGIRTPDPSPWVSSWLFGVAERIVAGADPDELLHLANLILDYARTIDERHRASVLENTLDGKLQRLDKVVGALLRREGAA